jgi:hypothetical protein
MDFYSIFSVGFGASTVPNAWCFNYIIIINII